MDDGIEILHSLSTRGLEFLVCRDEEGESLVARTPGGELDDFHVITDACEPAVIEDDAWRACGGIAPPGAARASFSDNGGGEVKVAVRNGAWIAVLDTGTGPAEPAVSYCDSSGTIVVIPRPDGTTAVEPVPDPAAPCAACSSATWELVRFVDDWDEDDKRLRCVNCGHREQLIIEGGTIALSNNPAVAKRIRADRLAGIASFAATALALENAASPARLSGWSGGRPDRWSGVTITHGDHGDPRQIAISTYTEPFGEPLHRTARRDHASAIHAKRYLEQRHEDPAHETLARQAAEREVERAAAAAPAAEIEATVEGVPIKLLAVGTPDMWSAIASLADRTLLITAKNWPMKGLALTGVDLAQFA